MELKLRARLTALGQSQESLGDQQRDHGLKLMVGGGEDVLVASFLCSLH